MHCLPTLCVSNGLILLLLSQKRKRGTTSCHRSWRTRPRQVSTQCNQASGSHCMGRPHEGGTQYAAWIDQFTCLLYSNSNLGSHCHLKQEVRVTIRQAVKYREGVRRRTGYKEGIRTSRVKLVVTGEAALGKW